MLKARVITALVLVPLLIAAILWLTTPILAIILGSIISIGAWEWSRLSGFTSLISRLAYVGLVIVLMFHTFSWIQQPDTMQYLLYGVFIWWLFTFVWLTITPAEKMLSNAINVYFRGFIGTILLIPSWLSLLVLHSMGGHGIYLLLSLFILIWVADSGAYFAGKLMGITKLAPAISPGKTIEGVYGGLITTALVAFMIAYLLGYSGIQLIQFSSIALLCAVFSIVGDLFESVAKRSTGIKDSGNIFPGHGGVMDRIDSLTAAGPLYLLALGWFPHLMEIVK